jgi:hypothetical protein
MGFYYDVILPRLCHLVMRNRHLLTYRERVIASAEGRVLEIGNRIGAELAVLRAPRARNRGLEPAPRLIAMARQLAERMPMPVTFMDESAAAIPLDGNTVDTVVMTWTLCTVPQYRRAPNAHPVDRQGDKGRFSSHLKTEMCHTR